MYGIAVFLIVALCAEILGTLGGFGSSTFFVPLAGFFYNLQTVLALTGILHVFSNLAKLFLFRKNIDYKLLLWTGVPSVIMVIAGAQLNAHVKLMYAELILGIFLVAFSSFIFLFPKLKLSANKTNSVTTGSIAGFLAGLIGTGGAIRGMGLAAFNLDKGTFVATSAAIDFGVDVSRSVVYLANGYLTSAYYFYLPLLLIVAVLGSWIGKQLLDKVSQANFKRIVLLLIFLTGAVQIIKSIT